VRKAGQKRHQIGIAVLIRSDIQIPSGDKLAVILSS
jgi:hypothetical protein